MLKKLRLERFKNFQKAELTLGPLTVLVGTNASGKSNLRDAFRFLHGISRNYNLAEIFGEKWVEGGILQWRGIRGGTREATFQGAETFVLEVSFSLGETNHEQEATYHIEVAPGIDGLAPAVVAEYLTIEGQEQRVFEAKSHLEIGQNGLSINVQGNHITENLSFPFTNYHPVVSQLAAIASSPTIKETCQAAMKALSSMRFLAFSPEVMRLPSFPGQTILGDRGENLSSVLQGICKNHTVKQALLDWIQNLAPIDVVNFDFPADFTGKILLTFIDSNAQKISAYSLADGILRFLALLTALFSSYPAQFYFFDPLESEIHPTRLHLLVELIERKAFKQNIQIIGTTHSSQLLRLLSPETIEYASLTYLSENRPDARILRILDIPDATRVVKEYNLARLHESAWLENVADCLENEEDSE